MPSSLSPNRLRIRVPAAVVPPVGPGSPPPWIAQAIAAGWQVGTWARISGATPGFGLSATNVMRDVKTVNPTDVNFQRSLSSWNGGARAPALGAYQSMLVGLGGAHSRSGSGYEGNDLFRFDLGTRAWTQLRPATANYNALTGNSFGEFPDGSPLPTHTYFQLACTGPLPGFPNGLLISPRAVSNYDDSTVAVATRYPHWLDLANPTAPWVRGDPIVGADTRNAWQYSPSGFWDAVRGHYVFLAVTRAQTANIVATLNPLASPGGQWTNRPPGAGAAHFWSGNGIAQSIVHDPIRDIVIFFDYRYTDTIRYLKPADLSQYRLSTSTAWLISETGTPPTRKVEGAGVDWSPALGAVLYWPGAAEANVFRLAYASGAQGAIGVDGNLTYNWTNITAPSNTLQPQSQVENPDQVFNRFQVFSYSGGVEIAIAVNTVDGSVDAFLVSAGA
jgi:hypothetical protein